MARPTLIRDTKTQPVMVLGPGSSVALTAGAGTITMAGTLSDRFVLQRAATGSISAAGGIRRKTQRALTGTFTATGAALRKTTRRLAGSTAASSSLVRRTRRKVAGSMAPAGALSGLYKTLKAVTGAVAATGTLARSYLPYVPSLASAAARALYSMLTRR